MNTDIARLRQRIADLELLQQQNDQTCRIALEMPPGVASKTAALGGLHRTRTAIPCFRDHIRAACAGLAEGLATRIAAAREELRRAEEGCLAGNQT